MARTFRCTVVTPSEAVFDDDVRYVSFPAWDGQQGVMSGQSPLLAKLGIGSLRVMRSDGESRWFLLEGGFAQIRGHVLTLLTERAEPAESLSAEQATTELADANARAVAGGADRARVEAAQQRARGARALAIATTRRQGRG